MINCKNIANGDHDVDYGCLIPKLVIIWINLKTLLPIAKDKNNELYAVLPESSIVDPDMSSQLFTDVRMLLVKD